MKYLLMIPALFLFLATASAQTTDAPAAKPAKAEMMKDHTCTKACVDGKHMHAHGEKGHACSAECKAMHKGEMKESHEHHGEMKGHDAHDGHDHGTVKEEKSEMKEKMKGEMKAHVCTAACKEGKHAYAHGEEGHTCDAGCKRMREGKK